MPKYTQEDIDKICNSNDVEFLENFGKDGKLKVLDYTRLTEGYKTVPTRLCSANVPDVLETGRILTELEYDGETYTCDGDYTKSDCDFAQLDLENKTVHFIKKESIKTTTAKVYDSKFKLEGNAILIFNQDTQTLEKYTLADGIELSSADKLTQLTVYNGFVLEAETDSAKSKIIKGGLTALNYLLAAALLFLIILIFKLKPFSLILMAAIAWLAVRLHKKIWG